VSVLAENSRRPLRSKVSAVTLLTAVSRHEFLINGLRNRDLRQLLYGAASVTGAEQRRQSAAVTRQLRLLRGHGLIHKVPRTHRCQLTVRDCLYQQDNSEKLSGCSLSSR
jgi:hypothetical protein